MKYKQRDFSPREQRLIHKFIKDIFCDQHLSDSNGDLYQCAWEAFLSVYRDNPSSFSSSSFRGWKRAYLIIWDALVETKRQNNFWLYSQASLDQEVSEEVQVSHIQLLQAPHGDFQNSVCFHDYLQNMDRDIRRTAYGLINGGSIEEIRSYYNWDHDYMRQICSDLRIKIKEYIDI